MTQSESIAIEIIKILSDYKPRILSKSQDRVSVYIQFDNLPSGLSHQLRVSNHEERKRYGFKWQLRLDGVPPLREQKRWSRYFATVDALCNNFVRYYGKVEQNRQMEGQNVFPVIGEKQ